MKHEHFIIAVLVVAVIAISATKFFTTTASAAKPLPPSNLIATALSPSQIKLTWTDNSNNELNFHIERSTTASGTYTQIATVIANVKTYTNNSLSVNTKYYYRVRAYSLLFGYSNYSNIANATTWQIAPAAPTNLTATAGATSSVISLSWTDNANNESFFTIERSTQSTSSYVTIATTTANAKSFYNSGLAMNSTYYYRVRAGNSAGYSNYSNIAAATTYNGIPLIAPSNLTATYIGSSTVRLFWSDRSSNENGFLIERSVGNPNNFTQIASTSPNITGYYNNYLSAGLYFFRIRAFKGSERSSYTNTASSTVF
jgi:hypothetical protein